MDNALVTPRGITPTGVAGALAPILVLLGSNRMPSYQVAALQLILVFLVQFLSIFYKKSAFDKTAIHESQPIKVEVVMPSSPVPTIQPVEKESAPVPTASEENHVLESQLDKSKVLEPARKAVKIIPEHPLYSNESIDACLRHFLAILDPEQLPNLAEGSNLAAVPATVPLSAWELLLNTPTTRVSKHPTIPHLYSISALYSDVPIRNLWELLIDITRRPSWDSMCYSAEEMDAIGSLDQSDEATRQASITYLATKGMFPIKANDMVMLSANARLLPEKPLRLVCATTSVEHPSKPVSRSYTRMTLSISGFMAEEDGQGGTRVTQLTDLSAIGSWVPGKIIRMVTESLIPKSLTKIGEVARSAQLQGPRAALTGDAWLPPLIGSWDELYIASSRSDLVDPLQLPTLDTSILSESTQRNGTASELISEDTESTASLEQMPASSARDVHELVLQLRKVNDRLSNLERTSGSAPSSVVSKSAPSTPPNGMATYHAGYHPPPPPFGLHKITDNSMSAPSIGGGPLGWLSRLVSALNAPTFLGGLGTGIFSTTTAATVAALAVFYFRKNKLIG